MQPAVKVAFNTIVLYAKILISMAISLVSVPIVLRALGPSDYGLYNLVAGVVIMLTFLNNTMTVSSQRYMSVAMGEGNIKKINSIYSSSFILHTALAIGIVIILEIVGLPSVGKLNIEPNRIWCANILFQCLVVSTLSRIIAVPFDAIMNAHEDMLVFSIIETINSVLLLLAAILLLYIPFDRLLFYGLCISLISTLTFIMKFIWCKCTYKKYSISLNFTSNKKVIKEMLGFTGWNLFGGLAMMGRNQGVAVIFNLFFGTLANTAYGIANQINGALSQFSSTIQRAINPQLMKSEGMGNRGRLHKISYLSSKFSVLALCLFSVPLIILMEDVLNIWLKENIPPYTLELSRYILILTICYQLSTGLMSAIQATGKIKVYQITMGSLILLNVPAAYVILEAGYPIYYVTIFFIMIEIVSFVIRLLMAKSIVGMNPISFLKIVIIPVSLIISVSSLVCFLPYVVCVGGVRIFLVSFSYGITYLMMIWYLAIDQTQRITILKRVTTFLGKSDKYKLSSRHRS